LDCFLGLSVVCHFHERKPARQPGVAIHDDMNLHHLSVGFEQPSKLLVRHLRIQVPTKRFFTTFPLSVTVSLWAVLGRLGKEDSLNTGAFLDVFQDRRVARFVPDDQ